MNISMSPGKCCPRGVPCLGQGCYALKALRLYPGTRAAWRRNELLAKHHPNSYFKQIAEQVAQAKPRLFRWHVAGDIFSIDYLGGMCRSLSQSTHALSGLYQELRGRQPIRSPRDSAIQPGDHLLGLAGNEVLQSPRSHRVAWMQDGTETRVPEDAIECPGNCRVVACATSSTGWAAMSSSTSTNRQGPAFAANLVIEQSASTTTALFPRLNYPTPYHLGQPPCPHARAARRYWCRNAADCHTKASR